MGGLLIEPRYWRILGRSELVQGEIDPTKFRRNLVGARIAARLRRCEPPIQIEKASESVLNSFLFSERKV
jgi:hypothetical protein